MRGVTAPDEDGSLRIATIRAEELESFLPLIEAYQRFYAVSDIDRGRNRGFFGRLIAPSHLGALLGAWSNGRPVGYACLHWSLDSVDARETVTLHDLWVEEEERGAGIGRALIEASADLAHTRGAQALLWETAPDNYTAQRLYDSMGAEASSWLHYELKL